MKQYEYLEHTSDEQFRAYGRSWEEAFTNAAYAMFDIITDHTKVESILEKKFSIKAENKEALVYDFLEEFLYYVDAEGILLHEINDLNINNNTLTVKFSGDDETNRYDINTHIKAVTYQNMIVKKKNDRYIIQVVVDI